MGAEGRHFHPLQHVLYMYRYSCPKLNLLLFWLLQELHIIIHVKVQEIHLVEFLVSTNFYICANTIFKIIFCLCLIRTHTVTILLYLVESHESQLFHDLPRSQLAGPGHFPGNLEPNLHNLNGIGEHHLTHSSLSCHGENLHR